MVVLFFVSVVGMYSLQGKIKKICIDLYFQMIPLNSKEFIVYLRKVSFNIQIIEL